MPRLTAPTDPPRPARAARAGVTLPELLVALTLLVLVGATLGTLLVTQLRLFARTQGTTQMQRDLRTGIALLPMDLRGAARSATGLTSDLVSLTDSAIELRATIGTAIVCERVDARTLDLPPLDAARNALTTWYAMPQPGDTALLYDVGTRPGPEDDRWVARPIASLSEAPLTSCAGAPFTDPLLDPPVTKRRWRLTFAVGSEAPDSVVAGSPVRFLRSVRYSLFRPGSDPDAWYLGYRELRGGAWQQTEAIAGPFETYAAGTRSGMRFVYFDTMGMQLSGAIPGDRVGRVDLALRTRVLLRAGSGARADSAVIRDSVAVRVALRNRT